MLYILLLVIAVGGLLWLTANRLAALDIRCERAFADIDVQLKHRHALLPNLLATVKGFQAQELAALEIVSRARAAALAPGPAAKRLKAEDEVSRGVTQLIAEAQAYPKLQSSDHFRALSGEIAGVEIKIAATRRFFNAAVAEYNAALRQFPASVLSRWLRGHGRREFYDIGVERALLDEAPAMKF
jgi:LemA protein